MKNVFLLQQNLRLTGFHLCIKFGKLGIVGLLCIFFVGNSTAPKLLAQTENSEQIFLPVIAHEALSQISGLNLALEQSTSQSSSAFGTAPGYAVDGLIDGDFANGSVSVTDVENEPWWQVDLGDVYALEQAEIWARTDCCTEELTDYYVFASEQNMGTRAISDLESDSTVWKTFISSNGSEKATVSLPTNARYVRIQMVGEKSLALSEVRVFGEPIVKENVVIQVARESESARAVEGSEEGAVYLVSRFGSLDEATVPFQINTSTKQKLESKTNEYLDKNIEPTSDFFFSDNVVFCRIPGVSFDEFPASGVASDNDYLIKDEDGNQLNGAITFKEGQTSKKIIVEALEDNEIEVPEIISIELIASDGVEINYTNDIEVYVAEGPAEIGDNSRLFVATMTAEGDAVTLATGLATVRLAEDNSFAMVSMSFSGLTSEQTASHIHIANPDSGPIAFSLPLGQFTNEVWGVKAAQFVETDQEMLDKLLSGGLYVNVHSANYPAGEIKGFLLEKTGSENPTLDYPMPDYEVLTGEELTRDITRFLHQSTFGPTPELIADLEARVAAENGDRIVAYEKWLDEQMEMDYPSQLAYYIAMRKQYISQTPAEDVVATVQYVPNITGPFYNTWFTHSIYAEAQLRERVAFALSQIFVVSMENNELRNRAYGVTGYNDLLKANAFGSYEQLLTDVSKSPVMGIYLSHLQNQANQFDDDGNLVASPDENYAREVMQLFSIGMVELHPDYSLKLGSDGLPLQTYTQDDITELARVFTGWSYATQAIDDGATPGGEVNTEFFYSGKSRGALYHDYLVEPMISFDDNGYEPDHNRYVKVRDDGEKVVLGSTFPAGQSGEEDMAQIMSVLADHANTAPFISYRLIQRLVKSNPSAGYIYRVSTVFEDTDGDLGETVKAILLDPEARNLAYTDLDGAGKVHEPLIKMMALMRLGNASYPTASAYELDSLKQYGLTDQQLDSLEPDAKRIFMSDYPVGDAVSFDQAPLTAPTVFNWYLPDFSPAGSIASAGLVAPELQHINSSIAVSYYNAIYSIARANGTSQGPLGLSPVEDVDRSRLKLEAPQPAIDAYMAVMDDNEDGTISEADVTFDDDLAVRDAVAAVVDWYDVNSCDSWLNHKATGNGATDVREIIIDNVIAAHSNNDGRTEERAIDARDDRLYEVMLAMFTIPQCVIHK